MDYRPKQDRDTYISHDSMFVWQSLVVVIKVMVVMMVMIVKLVMVGDGG